MTIRLSSILLLHSRALLDNVGTVLARKNGVAVLVELELDHLNLFNVNVCEGYGKYTRTAAAAYGHVLLSTGRVQHVAYTLAMRIRSRTVLYRTREPIHDALQHLPSSQTRARIRIKETHNAYIYANAYDQARPSVISSK